MLASFFLTTSEIITMWYPSFHIKVNTVTLNFNSHNWREKQGIWLTLLTYFGYTNYKDLTQCMYQPCPEEVYLVVTSLTSTSFLGFK